MEETRFTDVFELIYVRFGFSVSIYKSSATTGRQILNDQMRFLKKCSRRNEGFLMFPKLYGAQLLSSLNRKVKGCQFKTSQLLFHGEGD